MALLIKELWVPASTEEGTEFRECVVISMFKASMSQSFDKEIISTEQMFAICYYPKTGEIVETPINICIIKTLYDDKNSEYKNFSAPEKDGAAGEENR